MLRRLILPVLLTFAAVAAVAPSAHAAKGLEVGMQDDSVLVNHYWGSAPQAYARAKQLHASWVRVLVPWASTMTPQQARAKKKPKHITYNWAGFDAMIKDARARGFHVQLVLTGASPAWASGDHKVNGINSVSPNAREYGKWTFTAAKHFRGRKVTRYSIYNEVNHFGYLRPTGRKTLAKQATMYRNLYANGYKNIRRAYPKAQIFFGELAPYAKKGQSYSPLAFLRAVLCVNGNYKKRSKKCPKFVADGFAQHPYDNYHRRRGKDDVTMNSLGHLTSALDKLAKLGALRKHGHGKLSVYLTEFGYFSRTLNKSTVAVKPESKRAKLAVAAYQTALKNPRVKELVWYQYFEPPAASHQGWLSYFLHLDNSVMPTFTALQTWGNQHKGQLAK